MKHEKYIFFIQLIYEIEIKVSIIYGEVKTNLLWRLIKENKYFLLVCWIC